MTELEKLTEAAMAVQPIIQHQSDQENLEREIDDEELFRDLEEPEDDFEDDDYEFEDDI